MMINAAEVISEFKQIDKPIRVIAEESADGVIAAYIFCEFLKKNGKRFILSFEKKNISEVKEDYEHIVLISSYEPRNKVFKHFGVDEGDSNVKSFGIDASSLSEVVFFFCNGNVDFSDYGHLVVALNLVNIKGYCGKILENCVKDKKIVLKRGLRFFNDSSREIVQAVKHGYDPCLKSVFGDENKAVGFLKRAKIKDFQDEKRTIAELDDNESKSPLAEVLLDMIGLDEHEPFETLYFKDGHDLRVVKEMIGVCLKYHKLGIAYGFLNGHQGDVKMTRELYDNYSLEMIKALRKIFEAKQGKKMVIHLGEISDFLAEDLILFVNERKIADKPFFVLYFDINHDTFVHGLIGKEYFEEIFEKINGFGKFSFEDGMMAGKISDEEGFIKLFP